MEKSICFVALNIYPLLKKTSINFIGGAEVEQNLIGKELADRGYSVAYITLDHGQGLVSRIGSFEIFSAFNPSKGIPVLRFFVPRLVKLWQALNRTNADIYFFQCAGYLLGVLVFWARLNNKKVIFRGASDQDFEPKKLQLKYYRDKLMYFWGLKNCTVIIVQNSYQKTMLKGKFGRHGVLIHNGMKKHDGKSRSRDTILWVGNILKLKDPKTFIDLAKQMPEENFVMVGGIVEGQEELYETVTRETEKLCNLKFKGFMPLGITEKEFDKAKLFVNTSSNEGFPNTFLQAWRQGIPVLSFVDPDGLIGEHSLGRVAKNKEDMAKKMKSILCQEDKFNSQSIKNYFDENLVIEKQVDKYEEIFKSFVNCDE